MRTAFSIALLLAVTSIAHAVEQQREACPQTITDAQEYVGGAPEGWTAFGSRQEHPLQNVSFFSGSPEEKALLAPTSEHLKGKNPRAEWVFPPAQEPYWIACEYARTTVIVARPLAGWVRSCTVKYDPRFSSPVASSWQCKRD